jgi:hypothetical protein
MIAPHRLCAVKCHRKFALAMSIFYVRCVGNLFLQLYPAARINHRVRRVISRCEKRKTPPPGLNEGVEEAN